MSVEWVPISRALQCAQNSNTSRHFQPLLRDRGLERNRDSGRGLIIPLEEADQYGDDYRGSKYPGLQSEPSS